MMVADWWRMFRFVQGLNDTTFAALRSALQWASDISVCNAMSMSKD